MLIFKEYALAVVSVVAFRVIEHDLLGQKRVNCGQNFT